MTPELRARFEKAAPVIAGYCDCPAFVLMCWFDDLQFEYPHYNLRAVLETALYNLCQEDDDCRCTKIREDYLPHVGAPDRDLALIEAACVAAEGMES